MNDGHNVFDPKTSTFGAIRGLEYSPTDIFATHPELFKNFPSDWQTSDANGNEYHELIAHKILPTIADEHGVDLAVGRTASGGSSMGALTSMYALVSAAFGLMLARSASTPSMHRFSSSFAK